MKEIARAIRNLCVRRSSRCVYALSLAMGSTIAVLVSQAGTPGAMYARLFAREPAGVIRVMTWNVGDSAIVPPAETWPSSADDAPARFARVLRAIQPDVVCLQEVTSDAAAIVTLVSSILPLSTRSRWHSHQIFDNTIVSRFSLTRRSGEVFSAGTLRRGYATALVDLPSRVFPRDLYVLCAHFQSRAGEAQMALRQRQADAVAAWLRDAKQRGGQITLARRTPFVVMGDLNVIDTPSPSLATLLTGEIVDQATFGAGARPDWDGSPLTDLLPTHNAAGTETYTWRDDTQPFPPGALDRVLYSDSVLEVVRAYVLDTGSMTPDALAESGLRAADVMRDPARGIHDHLPVVADFIVKP